MTSGPNRAVIAIEATALNWSISSVATKATLAEASPTTLAFARLAMASLALAPLVRRSGARPGAPSADGLLLAGTACFAAYTILGRGAWADGGSLAVVAGSMRYGLVGLAPFAVGELAVVGVPAPSLSTVLLVLYLGAGCSAAAYALWWYGLSQLPVGQVALLGNLELLVGVAFAPCSPVKCLWRLARSESTFPRSVYCRGGSTVTSDADRATAIQSLNRAEISRLLISYPDENLTLLNCRW